jgi:hypothetical protein
MTVARAVAVCLAAVIATPAFADGNHIDRLDPRHLPLGDGRISTTPVRGYVMSCRTRFNPNAAGAQVNGPWIHGATWDLTEKFAVQGRVVWPQARFRIVTGEVNRSVMRLLEGNALPVNTPTGNFPVSPSDPAYRVDRNPNRITAQTVNLLLPKNPQSAAQASCVQMGMIGIALNGVPIFNAIDDGGRDAVAHEMQDLCNGHPQQEGEYHYHGPSPCLPGETGNERLLGYMADGFGIYSMYDAQGRELTDADLDECHGRVSTIDWDGKRVTMYHYVLTREYPYTVGCFRGTPVVTRPNRRPGQQGGPPGAANGGPPMDRPPPRPFDPNRPPPPRFDPNRPPPPQ